MDRPVRLGIVTCSDTRSEAEDTAGAALKTLITARGWQVVAYTICPDEESCIAEALIEMADSLDADVILTCGGTGFSPRDITPEVTERVAGRRAPGIAEHIRAQSLAVTPRAVLSRATAGIRGTTLIINLPGSEKAARESFGFVADQLEHAVDMMAGGGH
ncbi:MAG: MogA/MoaB family molybdenum cofactor biosynthesis protein [Anaerosomatales bacterium]|nr:MogA/MoaB family molybdenum cofactor biosynthesis protein [Coriobacteriia bacterium]